MTTSRLVLAWSHAGAKIENEGRMCQRDRARNALCVPLPRTHAGASKAPAQPAVSTTVLRKLLTRECFSKPRGFPADQRATYKRPAVTRRCARVHHTGLRLQRAQALNELKFFHGMAESQAIKFHCRGTQLATLFSRAMTASHLTAQSRSSAVYKRQHCSLVAERARPPAVARAHSHRGSLMLALCTCVHM